MLGEQLGEPPLVQRAAAAGGEVADQVHRHPVRGVKRENVFAADLEAGGGGEIGEPVQAAPDDPAEVALLPAEQAEYLVPALGQPGVAAGQLVDRGAGHLAEVEGTRARLGRGGYRGPEQPPRDITPALVGRGDALAEDEDRGPDVVGNEPDVALPGAGPGECRLRRRHDRGEQVSLVDGLAALQHHGHPFQPGAGVDAGEPQRLENAAGPPVELHEDAGVPDLDVPAGAVELAAGPVLRAVLRAGVVEHLGARAARSGVARGPEVVLVA